MTGDDGGLRPRKRARGAEHALGRYFALKQRFLRPAAREIAGEDRARVAERLRAETLAQEDVHRRSAAPRVVVVHPVVVDEEIALEELDREHRGEARLPPFFAGRKGLEADRDEGGAHPLSTPKREITRRFGGDPHLAADRGRIDDPRREERSQPLVDAPANVSQQGREGRRAHRVHPIDGLSEAPVPRFGTRTVAAAQRAGEGEQRTMTRVS